MEFEFDAAKSRQNREKHGIDFVEAQALVGGPGRTEVPARTEDEPRFLVVGRIDMVLWSVVVTYRNERHPDHLCTAVKAGGDPDL